MEQAIAVRVSTALQTLYFAFPINMHLSLHRQYDFDTNCNAEIFDVV